MFFSLSLSLSHVDPKLVLVASEKTCCGTMIFREARVFLGARIGTIT
jgi:hypothetical protein